MKKNGKEVVAQQVTLVHGMPASRKGVPGIKPHLCFHFAFPLKPTLEAAGDASAWVPAIPWETHWVSRLRGSEP